MLPAQKAHCPRTATRKIPLFAEGFIQCHLTHARTKSTISMKSMKSPGDKERSSSLHCFYGTATVGERGQIVIPKAIRASRNIVPGDGFEILTDEDDVDLILLRRIRRASNLGLVEHLGGCPQKGGLSVPSRRRERMRPVRL